MSERESQIRETTWREYLANPWASLERINPALLESREIQELKSWYEARVKALPFMKEEEGPITDGKNWDAEFIIEYPGTIAKPIVNRIHRPDKLFYAIEGRKYTKYKDESQEQVLFSWNQPVIITQEVLTHANILGEELKIPVNGFLGTIRDTDGRILMTVDQEATAETPNHAIVRLAIQASAGKIALMRSGKPEADKGLSELLKIYPGGDIEQLLDKAEFIMPVPPEDTNRDIKHNLLLIMPPIGSHSPLHAQLVEDGTRMWLSEIQRAAINATRLTNSHTITAVSFDRDVRLLRNLTSL